MPLDKIALILVIVGAGVWCLAVFTGIVATLPWGLPILAVFAVVIYLVYRVVRDRLQNTEDDYYEKNVKQ
jgi:hypothetical protein